MSIFSETRVLRRSSWEGHFPVSLYKKGGSPTKRLSVFDYHRRCPWAIKLQFLRRFELSIEPCCFIQVITVKITARHFEFPWACGPPMDQKFHELLLSVLLVAIRQLVHNRRGWGRML
jgi:hypothetical protein